MKERESVRERREGGRETEGIERKRGGRESRANVTCHSFPIAIPTGQNDTFSTFPSQSEVDDRK